MRIITSGLPGYLKSRKLHQGPSVWAPPGAASASDWANDVKPNRRSSNMNRKVTRQHTQGMPVRDRFTLESAAGSTRVVETIEAEPDGLFKLATPVLVPLLKRQLEVALVNLKELIEA